MASTPLYQHEPMWSVAESHSSRDDWPASPPPPWRANVRAMLWWHRSAVAASELGLGIRALPLTVAMMVDYLDSPVGPYREVLASPLVLAPSVAARRPPAIAVPFIAVDSERSVHGGRTHWRLPKVLAGFEGEVTDDVTAAGDGWSVRAVANPRGPAVPIVGVLPFAQPAGDGSWLRASVRLRGWARWARTRAEAEGPTLSTWLRSGNHHGVVITTATLTVTPGRAS